MYSINKLRPKVLNRAYRFRQPIDTRSNSNCKQLIYSVAPVPLLFGAKF